MAPIKENNLPARSAKDPSECRNEGRKGGFFSIIAIFCHYWRFEAQAKGEHGGGAWRFSFFKCHISPFSEHSSLFSPLSAILKRPQGGGTLLGDLGKVV